MRTPNELEALALLKAGKNNTDALAEGDEITVDFTVNVTGTIKKGEGYDQNFPVLQIGSMERMILILMNKVNPETAKSVTEKMVFDLLAESMAIDESKVQAELDNIKKYANDAFKKLSSHMVKPLRCNGKTTAKIVARILEPSDMIAANPSFVEIK